MQRCIYKPALFISYINSHSSHMSTYHLSNTAEWSSVTKSMDDFADESSWEALKFSGSTVCVDILPLVRKAITRRAHTWNQMQKYTRTFLPIHWQPGMLLVYQSIPRLETQLGNAGGSQGSWPRAADHISWPVQVLIPDHRNAMFYPQVGNSYL